MRTVIHRVSMWALLVVFCLVPVAARANAGGIITVPLGDLISVQIQSNLGSRISVEGDAFAVVTIEDYYVKGKLILPKGTPG